MTLEIGHNGILLSSNVFTIHLMFACNTITILRLVYKTCRGPLMLFFATLDFLVVAVSVLFLTYVKRSNDSVYEVSILELFTNLNSLGGFFLSIFLAFIIDWSIWESHHLPKCFPIYCFLRSLAKTNQVPDTLEETNSILSTLFGPNPEIGDIVRNCFAVEDGSKRVIRNR